MPQDEGARNVPPWREKTVPLSGMMRGSRKTETGKLYGHPAKAGETADTDKLNLNQINPVPYST